MGISNAIIESDSFTLVQILENKNMDYQWDVKAFVHTIFQVSPGDPFHDFFDPWIGEPLILLLKDAWKEICYVTVG